MKMSYNLTQVKNLIRLKEKLPFLLTSYGVLLISTLLCFASFGQTPSAVTDQINKMMPRPTSPSPNVASLWKYGDYEVNLFTGLPDISISIFEAKSGNISVPVIQ
jgi:hypothetical protein